MGRTSYSICDDCDVYQYNGYGSCLTWLDYCTNLAAFDAAVDDEPQLAILHKNKNVRAFLVTHDGHAVTFATGSDFYTDEDERLFKSEIEGKTEVKAPYPTN